MKDSSNKVNQAKNMIVEQKMCCNVEKYSARGISFN